MDNHRRPVGADWPAAYESTAELAERRSPAAPSRSRDRVSRGRCVGHRARLSLFRPRKLSSGRSTPRGCYSGRLTGSALRPECPCFRRPNPRNPLLARGLRGFARVCEGLQNNQVSAQPPDGIGGFWMRARVARVSLAREEKASEMENGNFYTYVRL